MVTYKHNFSPTHAIVKLVNGDELITTITEKTDAGITIAKPAQVLRIMMPTGQAMIQCANYLIFNNSNPYIKIWPFTQKLKSKYRTKKGNTRKKW